MIVIDLSDFLSDATNNGILDFDARFVAGARGDAGGVSIVTSETGTDTLGTVTPETGIDTVGMVAFNFNDTLFGDTNTGILDTAARADGDDVDSRGTFISAREIDKTGTGTSETATDVVGTVTSGTGTDILGTSTDALGIVTTDKGSGTDAVGMVAVVSDDLLFDDTNMDSRDPDAGVDTDADGVDSVAAA